MSIALLLRLEALERRVTELEAELARLKTPAAEPSKPAKRKA